MSKPIPVVPFGLDLTYPAELQNLCAEKERRAGGEESQLIRRDDKAEKVLREFVALPSFSPRASLRAIIRRQRGSK